MARRGLAVLVVVVAVFAGASAWVRAQSGRAAVEGAWVLQDYSYAKPSPVRLNKPTGMLLFTGNHYAFVLLRQSASRSGS